MNTADISYTNSDNSFSIFRSKKTGYFNMTKNHFHNEYEIYYLLSGERNYFIGDRTFHVIKGDLVLINNFDVHKTTDSGVPSHERILIHFRKEFLQNKYNEMQEILFFLFNSGHNTIRLPAHERNFVESLLFRMLQEVQTMPMGFEAYLQSLLIQLAVFLDRHIEKGLNKPFEHLSETHKKISEIAQYISRNYNQPITLSLLSERFFISPYYLTRIFKKLTGFTLIEYLNSVRVKQAQILLVESRWKMDKITEKCGFGSISHFGRVFKSVSGVSPLQYRNINNNSG